MLDRAFASGVFRHEPGGLSTRELLRIIQNLHTPIVGKYLIECNPKRDPLGITATIPARLLKEIDACMIESIQPLAGTLRRISLGQSLSFGLQSLIGADIFESTVAPTRNNAGQLTNSFLASPAIGTSILMFNKEVELKGSGYARRYIHRIGFVICLKYERKFGRVGRIL